MLILFMFIGFPIEFRNMFSERIARIIISISLIFIFLKLFYLSKKLASKKFKILLTIIIAIIALPYTLICIYNFSTGFSNNYARWKDISILENKNGEKMVYQVRESGSIYDYRYRKIFYENKSIRISINCDFGKVTGWTETKNLRHVH